MSNHIPATDICEPANPPRATRRDGLALPLAIMVLALVTMGVVAGFAVSSSEISTVASQRAQARAFTSAQMGLEMFLARRKEPGFCPKCWLVNATSPPNGSPVTPTLDTLPTKAETVTVRVAGGSAYIKAVPVWLDIANGKGTYFITSTGVDSLSLTGGGKLRTKAASRTVGTFATWSNSTINVLGALVSFSGVRKNGTGAISGVDECGKKASVPGITVPAEADVQVQGNSFTPTGNPPYDTLKTFAQDSANSKLDWAAIKAGTLVPADIVIPGGAFPSTATFAADTNYWPVIHILSTAIQPWRLTKGRGTLIVDGDLDIDGNNQWDGVILVGGQLTSNGNNVTSGTVMSGLNTLLGSNVQRTIALDDSLSMMNGQKSYVYNSCSVDKATKSLARYTAMPNTWMDNVAGY
jgi:hypothetical protein